MMRKHIRKSTSCFLFGLVLMSLVLMPVAAEAGIISFRFEGHVTAVKNLPIMSAGDTFSGVLYYNTNLLLDRDPGDPDRGDYKLDPAGSAAGISIVVNNQFQPAYSQSPGQAFGAEICVHRFCTGGGPRDSASIAAWGPDKAFVIGIGLFAYVDVWDSDALPTDINVDNFLAKIYITIFESHSSFSGPLTEMHRVDEPYVLPSVLAGLLLATLFGARRRRVLGSQVSPPISDGFPWQSQRKPG